MSSHAPIEGWKYFFYRKDGSNKPKFGFRYLLLIRHIPFVNFFWDMFFDGRTPGESEVKDLLNMLGLLNALLLESGVGIFASVNFAELTAADELYADPTQGYSVWWNSGNTLPPSNTFYLRIHLALTMFFTGVLAIVWVFSDMLGKIGEGRDVQFWKDFYKYQDKKSDEQELKPRLSDFQLERLILTTTGRNDFDKWRYAEYEVTFKPEEIEKMEMRRKIHREAVFHIYWGYAKYAVILSILNAIIGCFFAVIACDTLFTIKYPDYCMQKTGTSGFSPECPREYSAMITQVIVYGVTIFTVVVTGLGTGAKYGLEEVKKDEARDALNSEKTDEKKRAPKTEFQGVKAVDGKVVPFDNA
jgi:hypothetical protein